MLSVSDTENVARIGRIPEGSRMAQVALACEQEFQGDVFWSRGVGEEFVRTVMGCDVGT